MNVCMIFGHMCPTWLWLFLLKFNFELFIKWEIISSHVHTYIHMYMCVCVPCLLMVDLQNFIFMKLIAWIFIEFKKFRHRQPTAVLARSY